MQVPINDFTFPLVGEVLGQEAEAKEVADIMRQLIARGIDFLWAEGTIWLDGNGVAALQRNAISE